MNLKLIIACGLLLFVLFFTWLQPAGGQPVPLPPFMPQPPLFMEPEAIAAPMPYTNYVVALGAKTNYPGLAQGTNVLALPHGWHGELTWEGSDDFYFIGYSRNPYYFTTLYYVGPATNVSWPLPEVVTVQYNGTTIFSGVTTGNQFFGQDDEYHIPGITTEINIFSGPDPMDLIWYTTVFCQPGLLALTKSP